MGIPSCDLDGSFISPPPEPVRNPRLTIHCQYPVVLAHKAEELLVRFWGSVDAIVPTITTKQTLVRPYPHTTDRDFVAFLYLADRLKAAILPAEVAREVENGQ